VHARTHARAHTHRNMNYLLLFHCNNSFVNALQCYVYTYIACVFCFQDVSNLNTILPFDGIFIKVILGEISGFRRGVVKAFAREEYCPSYAGRLGPLEPRRCPVATINSNQHTLHNIREEWRPQHDKVDELTNKECSWQPWFIFQQTAGQLLDNVSLHRCVLFITYDWVNTSLVLWRRPWRVCNITQTWRVQKESAVCLKPYHTFFSLAGGLTTRL
jgi:hypothetical protein